MEQRKVEPSARFRRASATWMPPGGVSSNARRAASFHSSSFANSVDEQLADERAAARAAHLLEEAVAALDHAVAHEGDADGGVVEDQILLGERALHPHLGLALRR